MGYLPLSLAAKKNYLKYYFRRYGAGVEIGDVYYAPLTELKYFARRPRLKVILLKITKQQSQNHGELLNAINCGD